MSYENRGKTISLIADVNYAKRYIPVSKTNVDEQFTLCAAGGAPVGVAQDPSKAGTACAIMINGVSMMHASAVIAAGAEVAVTADGTVAAAVAGAGAFGVALNAATAAGDIISVLLRL